MPCSQHIDNFLFINTLISIGIFIVDVDEWKTFWLYFCSRKNSRFNSMWSNTFFTEQHSILISLFIFFASFLWKHYIFIRKREWNEERKKNAYFLWSPQFWTESIRVNLIRAKLSTLENYRLFVPLDLMPPSTHPKLFHLDRRQQAKHTFAFVGDVH